jgi:Fe-S-cluster containining protein
MMALGPHRVPAIWRRMLPDDLADMRFPSECGATCSNCPMVQERGFHPDYRCCTYHPVVPNFLIGFALSDPETAPMFMGEIDQGFATPEGLHATAARMKNSLQHAVNKDFGKLTSVACKFLDPVQRRCRAYKYRNSVCSTFFCKNDQADKGQEFWERLQALAGQVETHLAQWSMRELGMNPTEYFARMDRLAANIERFNDPVTESWTEEAQKFLWGDWFGREREFFLKCAELVDGHQDSLFQIAETNTLQSPKEYDRRFRNSLPENLQKELDANHSTDGEPVPVSDLWYQLQLAHRNLWRT